ALNPAKAVIWRNRGNLYASLGRSKEALADYHRALAVQPDDLDTLAARAATYLSLDCPLEALADLARASEQALDDRLITLWADVYQTLLDPKWDTTDQDLAGHILRTVRDALSQNLQNNPDKIGLYSERGLLELTLHDYESAVDDFTRALDAQPGD